jgi:hypothetical protein
VRVGRRSDGEEGFQKGNAHLVPNHSNRPMRPMAADACPCRRPPGRERGAFEVGRGEPLPTPTSGGGRLRRSRGMRRERVEGVGGTVAGGVNRSEQPRAVLRDARTYVPAIRRRRVHAVDLACGSPRMWSPSTAARQVTSGAHAQPQPLASLISPMAYSLRPTACHLPTFTCGGGRWRGRPWTAPGEGALEGSRGNPSSWRGEQVGAADQPERRRRRPRCCSGCWSLWGATRPRW